jgi:hypothetical protein
MTTTTTTRTTQRLIDELAAAVAETGFAPHARELSAVADQARAAGVPAALTDLLLDPTEPEIVRFRAFGVVTRSLAALLDSESCRTERTPDAAAAPAPGVPVTV